MKILATNHRKFRTEEICAYGTFFFRHLTDPFSQWSPNSQDDIERVIKGDFDFKGKIALSETFKTTPVPALHVDGIGLVGSPLSERDAKLIEATATQAPFRKGTKTVVDASVKDTFEINPDKFSLKNPAWTEFLNTVTKKVATGLSLPPNLPPPRAELYKLLLYKTGSQSVRSRSFACSSPLM